MRRRNGLVAKYNIFYSKVAVLPSQVVLFRIGPANEAAERSSFHGSEDEVARSVCLSPHKYEVSGSTTYKYPE